MSLRQALDGVVDGPVLARDEVAGHYARFAGVPATSRASTEPVMRYRVSDSDIPVVLGFYGSEERVRSTLPGLPARAGQARELLARTIPPVHVPDERTHWSGVDLSALPVLRATPRDAGPYLTMGAVYARRGGATAFSVHRMLVLGRDRLAIWMLPSRALRAMHADALAAGERLAVSVNIGIPPAAMIASALSTALLPVDKLDVAGALAGAPVALAPSSDGATSVVADAEIALEGYIGAEESPEALDGMPDRSLPEFLGYDGSARDRVPVLTVTGVSTVPSPVYQAVIGPGREQSVILGVAGGVSLGLCLEDDLVVDAHFSPAGGGMLLLAVALRKASASDDDRLPSLAQALLRRHPFVKLIVFTDDDVDVSCAEDVLWAMTTRSNLGVDAITLPGPGPLGMDPSQRPSWRRGGGEGRTYVDATIPFGLDAARSFGGGT
ncbi:UbiD family decarboxylase [Actinokineospora auranticolor]|nr:UbiD family decarboxylase [Actinokineospora auranticolor]